MRCSTLHLGKVDRLAHEQLAETLDGRCDGSDARRCDSQGRARLLAAHAEQDVLFVSFMEKFERISDLGMGEETNFLE